ncbi:MULTISPECIES: bifunctional diaminohydroxyphosphoribosylaminopyrimidine deaminase/5-amino-6-(5-phosphoribosylamino)uracil reductase RibD [Thalassotalea]|uniref:bifunctional diaminohydroxyphosphoribosylaminopyrimidine deaminase/5-amino-6-(5-phosphoribosylamino)uracil reductase RibD n=1 Tax=Thalassotalea TaxID=1518149 RepID=UPI00094587DF|nr:MULTISPECIES: bifunctional diaminohydroxyphosphoribosylaminopyrimidine deaminase/5-amino-6-(5-phosphoribosylamino)uracil reductase RibD [Thalassotalea]OKY24889.1 riboflavin biosynthesis protein RibD [Thalassotalea sp. PP2-459]
MSCNTFTLDDHRYMARAIALAKKGLYTVSPNPRVGCVLVKDGKVVGEGWHQQAGSAHAEVNALAQAEEQAKGATAYVTLEPCSHYGKTPPCAKGLIDAGVVKVIAAMVDPNPQVSGNGLSMLTQAGIETASGLLEADAQALNVGFIALMTQQKPYVRCKLAASLDGKTAMSSGESKWITSREARCDVQQLRAQSCAVISGADSILHDNARMTVRWSELGDIKQHYAEQEVRQPVRVVIDSQNRLTPDLALFETTSPVLILTARLENTHQWPHFVEHICVKQSQCGHYIDLTAALKVLADKGLNDVLIESGMELAGAFIEQNLVDELILYQAPKLLGHAGKGLVNFSHIDRLTQAKSLHIQDVTRVGGDIKIVAHFTHDKVKVEN